MLTALIPCKNERQNIRSCIESVRLVADEILVADSGSTDGTLEIVGEMDGCRLIQHEWIGFGAFKNWAIPHATHPWVLIVDADERITPELAEEIRELLADPPEQIDAYRIRRRTFYLGHEIRYSGQNTNSACRLIRRDVCRYGEQRVHEEIEVAQHCVRRLKHKMIHYEYRSLDHYFAKRVHYTKLWAEERWEKGRRTGFAGLLVRPCLRFLQLYFLRLGFLDGLAGVQLCMLSAFFYTFIKQARLWEMQNAIPLRTTERRMEAEAQRTEHAESFEQPECHVLPHPKLENGLWVGMPTTGCGGVYEAGDAVQMGFPIERAQIIR